MIDTDMNDNALPECFGTLEKVFPITRNGLRESPDDCMYLCAHKTECLRCALASEQGVHVKEEMIQRGEKAGRISFIERWARKKRLHNHQSRKLK